MSSSRPNGGAVVSETRIVDEIPDSMQRLASMVARGFYGPEHAIVVDYLKRNVCIKEETLRDIIKFEQRHLRQILIQLKVDKLIKERIVAEETTDGRSRKVNCYFINYRALINVTKYKIDHMRQKLESREKDDTHKASYKCSGCHQHYDVMDIDKIYDPMTQQMRCWRCQSLVEDDETAGPSTSTRTMLAKFNDELAPLFSILQQLDGVQLAQHLHEPALPTASGSSRIGDDGQSTDGRKLIPNQNQLNSFNMYTNQAFTVSIEGDGSLDSTNAGIAGGSKQMPTWLQDSAHHQLTEQQDSMAAAHIIPGGGSTAVGTNSNEAAAKDQKDIVASLLMHEMDAAAGTSADGIWKSNNDEPMIKIEAKVEEDADDDDADDSSDFEDIHVSVQGVAHPLHVVSSRPALIAQMTDAERDQYVIIMRDQMQGLT